jgi:branched-chain amino acid transport system substrate-binding protein
VRQRTCIAILCLLLCLRAGFLFGCSRGTLAEAPIVLGLIAYQPEPVGADFGAQMVQAAQLAVDQVNGQGGLAIGGSRRHVKLAVEVTAATPESAVAAANRLINQDSVAAIVGPHWSREALPVAEIAEGSRIPLISTGSTHPKTTLGKRYVFRIPFTDALQGRVLASFARRDLRAGTAAVLRDAADPYTAEIAGIFTRAFEAAGGNVIADETYTPDAKVDYGAQLRRIRAHNPRVLLLPVRSDDAIEAVRQARALGITATVLGTDMWRPENVTAELEGAYFTRPEQFDERRLAVLTKAFTQEYQAAPGVEAVETYDAIGVIVAAIRFSGDGTPEAIRNGLYRMGPYPGVTGVIDYVTDGSPARSVVIFHVRDTRAVPHRELREDASP